MAPQSWEGTRPPPLRVGFEHLSASNHRGSNRQMVDLVDWCVDQTTRLSLPIALETLLIGLLTLHFGCWTSKVTGGGKSRTHNLKVPNLTLNSLSYQSRQEHFLYQRFSLFYLDSDLQKSTSLTGIEPTTSKSQRIFLMSALFEQTVNILFSEVFTSCFGL